MKLFLLLAVIVGIAPALVADAGVSVQIGEPGFYGSIDIGGYPQPQLINPQPVVIEPGGVEQPIYLHVPPGHAKNWRKHCHQYNACGRPVYFVKDSWYRNEYVPRYRQTHGHGHGEHHDHDHGHD